jgi:uncharacterized protein YbbC (DUF1343 family)
MIIAGTESFFLPGNGEKEAVLLLQEFAGKSAQEISAMWQEDVKRFQKQRRPYLLYDEVF